MSTVESSSWEVLAEASILLFFQSHDLILARELVEVAWILRPGEPMSQLRDDHALLKAYSKHMVLAVRVVLLNLRMACDCVFDGVPLLEWEIARLLEENGYGRDVSLRFGIHRCCLCW